MAAECWDVEGLGVPSESSELSAMSDLGHILPSPFLVPQFLCPYFFLSREGGSSATTGSIVEQVSSSATAATLEEGTLASWLRHQQRWHDWKRWW